MDSSSRNAILPVDQYERSWLVDLSVCGAMVDAAGSNPAGINAMWVQVPPYRPNSPNKIFAQFFVIAKEMQTQLSYN